MRGILTFCFICLVLWAGSYDSVEAGQSSIYYQNLIEKQIYPQEIITNSVPDRPFVEEKREISLSNSNYTYLIKRSGVKVTRTSKGLEKIEDFDNGTLTIYYKGQKIEPLIYNPDGDAIPDLPMRSTEAEVLFEYDRFNVYIDSAYYYNNQTELDDLLMDFEPRFDTLESRSGWNSESSIGLKLQITILPYSSCRFGYASPGDATVFFHDPYYDFLCDEPFGYMKTIIHECTHGITPIPIYARTWLAEGWTTYEQFNTLVTYGDMYQSFVDNEIFQGHTSYNWTGYVANDYLDPGYSADIQSSLGYYITSWMFTMMRNDHGLDFSELYKQTRDNPGTLERAFELLDSSYYFTDMAVIDMFGRASGLDFQSTKDIWEYDGPGGPGWGVRYWVDRDWYGDVSPKLYAAASEDKQSAVLRSVIHNYGSVNFYDMPVNIYEDNTLIDSFMVDIPPFDSVVVITPITQSEGSYPFKLIVDEYDIKVEQDETNNEDTLTVVLIDSDSDNYFNVLDCDDGDPDINPGAFDILDDGIDQNCDGLDATCCIGQRGDIDYNGSAQADIADLLFLVDYMFLPPGSSTVPACMKEADVNSDGSSIPDISDLLFLVDYMFLPSGAAPVPGPCME